PAPVAKRPNKIGRDRFRPVITCPVTCQDGCGRTLPDHARKLQYGCVTVVIVSVGWGILPDRDPQRRAQPGGGSCARLRGCVYPPHVSLRRRPQRAHASSIPLSCRGRRLFPRGLIPPPPAFRLAPVGWVGWGRAPARAARRANSVSPSSWRGPSEKSSVRK